MKKFLLSVICFISIMSCNVFAKEQSLSVSTSGDDVPIVYSGKYYTNTSNITVKDFDVLKVLNSIFQMVLRLYPIK